MLLLAALPAAAQSNPAAQGDLVTGKATFTREQGYARLVFKFPEEVDVKLTMAGSILVISFDRPVDVPVEGIANAVPDYVSAARRDPDGSAVRLSLAQKVTINTMTAGKRVFVDFLPDGWTGPPPSLPLKVVQELAKEARAAERLLGLQRAAAQAMKRPPIRVRALVQPTFVRFVFPMPDGVGASSVLNDQKLTLSFTSLLNFDLADARVAKPPNIASIKQRVEANSTLVEISLIGDVDVHSFRDDKDYIVDVAFQQPDKASAQLKLPLRPAARAPPPAQLVPAPPAAAAPTPAKQPQPVSRASQAAPRKAGSTAPQARLAMTAGPVAKPPAAPVSPPPVSAKPQAASRAPVVSAQHAKPPPATAETNRVPRAQTRQIAQAAKPSAPPAALPPVKPPDNAAAAAKVNAMRDGEGLHLTFTFPKATAAASFQRGDTVWLVFDSRAPLDVASIRANGGDIIGGVSRMPLPDGQAIRIRLNRPQMHSLSTDEFATGAKWTLSFADKVLNPPRPLTVLRNIADRARADIVVPFVSPSRLHKITDPDAGDTLLVVTALPPVRGFLKRERLVDLTLLDTDQGIAIRQNSNGISVKLAPDKVVISKPGGLVLSPVDVSAERAPTAVRPIFDIDEWRKNRAGSFSAREDELMTAAAEAKPQQRWKARLALAHFYMARGMYAEAEGETAFMLANPTPKMDQSVVLMAHAIAAILMGRPKEGLKDLAGHAIGKDYHAQLWKGLADAREGKWVEAQEKFKNVELSVASLPLELQRIITADAMRASLEVKDYAGAARLRSELDVVGVPAEMKPRVSVLYGRLAEALGHDKDALDDYHFAMASSDSEAAAAAKLREIALRQRRGEISQADELRELEILEVTWRGDSTEVNTLQMLARIYSQTGRYAESLAAARTAIKLQPKSTVSQKAEDEAAALFSQIFRTRKGDKLSPIDALALFYRFRELTPIGPLGDEIIRRLADRLVAVDLLDQAAKLLQYQVDHRLEGAARAQVAAKLAMVYLADRKPEKAIGALDSTRIADLNGELRAQRLLLESRAQSEIGRHDLALELISHISGRVAIRLRSDIYWGARKWRQSAEQIELYYGSRWRDFRPLNAAEKADVIRAAIGYALANDTIGLARFREKYAPLMSGEADKRAFDIAGKPTASDSPDFAEVAKMAASQDTLDAFLREMRARFPDTTAWTPPTKSSEARSAAKSSLPQIAGIKRADAE